jgi:site-specific DNA-methyltransferase (adenine-specific)
MSLGHAYLYDEDALAWMQSLEDECADLVVTDPAYSSLEKHRKRGTKTRLKKSSGSDNQWFPVVSNAYLHMVMWEFYRILKPNTHCYVMCDEETLGHLKDYGREVGFTFWKSLIWDKGRMGMGYHYRGQCERIAFFEKGKRHKLNNLGVSDVLPFKRVDGVGKKKGDPYPTEKPVDLLKVLIENSSDEGETVLDCFMGSGSTMEAAVTTGRNFWGTDIQSIDWATDRFKTLQETA